MNVIKTGRILLPSMLPEIKIYSEITLISFSYKTLIYFSEIPIKNKLNYMYPVVKKLYP